jgi:hypothetical protein
VPRVNHVHVKFKPFVVRGVSSPGARVGSCAVCTYAVGERGWLACGTAMGKLRIVTGRVWHGAAEKGP